MAIHRLSFPLIYLSTLGLLVGCSGANPGKKSGSEPQGARSSDAAVDQATLDAAIREKGEPSSRWTCGNHWDRGPHKVSLDYLDPQFGPGFQLFLRPRKGHCETEVLSVTLVNTKSGARHALPCSENCEGDAFLVPVNTKRSWQIPSETLNEHFRDDDDRTAFQLHYELVGQKDSRCDSQSSGAHFGLAVALRFADSDIPSSRNDGGCESFDLN